MPILIHRVHQRINSLTKKDLETVDKFVDYLLYTRKERLKQDVDTVMVILNKAGCFPIDQESALKALAVKIKQHPFSITSGSNYVVGSLIEGWLQDTLNCSLEQATTIIDLLCSKQLLENSGFGNYR
jgi:hypothetical protein